MWAQGRKQRRCFEELDESQSTRFQGVHKISTRPNPLPIIHQLKTRDLYANSGFSVAVNRGQHEVLTGNSTSFLWCWKCIRAASSVWGTLAEDHRFILTPAPEQARHVKVKVSVDVIITPLTTLLPHKVFISTWSHTSVSNYVSPLFKMWTFLSLN